MIGDLYQSPLRYGGAYEESSEMASRRGLSGQG